MDAFSPIPNHTGFTARSLFTDAQGTLKDGAFANMEPGGGGPLSPHRHAHAHLFIVTRGTVVILLDEEEKTVREARIRWMRPAALSTASSITLKCSFTVKVGDSPVVPTATMPATPAATWASTSILKASSSTRLPTNGVTIAV